ncbi:outer membrane beta-barrel protein [Lysobacter brunescens]|uniref:Outer membrane beta-barrel protein n=1 Tax=Lysobacter brunescens TaxID=262323 RepID=A0ABW2Y9F7_9GAMM
MKKLLAAAMLLAITPFAASARDSLGSFTYVEAGVQRLSVDDGTDSLDFDGVGIRTSIELSDNFYVYGGYAWARNDDLAVDIDARDMQIGLGYRHTVFDNADLTAELGFQHTELDSDLFRDNLDGARLSLGLRGALSNNFEGWVKANYVDGSDYEGEFSGTLGGQLIINETWGIVGEVEAGDLASRYTLGVRASF